MICRSNFERLSKARKIVRSDILLIILTGIEKSRNIIKESIHKVLKTLLLRIQLKQAPKSSNIRNI
jgi:hypothetical protein